MLVRKIKPDGDKVASIWNDLSVRIEQISKEVQQLKQIINR